jgi:hypothetical protein
VAARSAVAMVQWTPRSNGKPFDQCSALLPQLSRAALLSMSYGAVRGSVHDHFFAGDLDLEPDLEPHPDVEGAPCVVIEGAGATPDGACIVLPPGAGSGTGSGVEEMGQEALPAPVPIATARWWQDLGIGHWLMAAALQ